MTTKLSPYATTHLLLALLLQYSYHNSTPICVSFFSSLRIASLLLIFALALSPTVFPFSLNLTLSRHHVSAFPPLFSDPTSRFVYFFLVELASRAVSPVQPSSSCSFHPIYYLFSFYHTDIYSFALYTIHGSILSSRGLVAIDFLLVNVAC